MGFQGLPVAPDINTRIATDVQVDHIWHDFFTQLVAKLQSPQAQFTLPYPYLSPIRMVGRDVPTGFLKVEDSTTSVTALSWAIAAQTVAINLQTTGQVLGVSGQAFASAGGGTAIGVLAWAGDGQQFVPPVAPATLYGIQALVLQQWDNITGATRTVGIQCLFSNRVNAGLPPLRGLGSNRYAAGAIAVEISSQSPSSAGEACGWGVGISFSAVSMAQPAAGISGVGIDMSLVPLANMNVGLLMAQGVSINQGTISFKYTGTKWQLLNSGVEIFAINNSGAPIFDGPTSSSATAGAASALPATPREYLSVTTTVGPGKIPVYAN